MFQYLNVFLPMGLEFSENAEEFLDALKENKDDDEVKGLFGRHVITQHMHCDDIKERFSKYVHESGK